MAAALKKMQDEARAKQRLRAANLSSPGAAVSPSSSSLSTSASASAERSKRTASSSSQRGKATTVDAAAAAAEGSGQHSFLDQLAKANKVKRQARVRELADAFGEDVPAAGHSATPEEMSSADQLGRSVAEHLLLALTECQTNSALADNILNYFAPEALCFYQGAMHTSSSFCKTLVTASIEHGIGFVTSSLEANGQVQVPLPPSSNSGSGSGAGATVEVGLRSLNSSIAMPGSDYTVLSTLSGTLVVGGQEMPFMWRNRLVHYRATESWLVVASEFACG
jgi:hypothetical protein